MFEQLAVSSSEPVSLVSLLLHLGVAVALAVLLRWHFVTFASTLSNRGAFAQVFPLVLMTTVLIISVVKTSLALSLGLVGALSIVRFRTPIKEPEELAYLFLAIAIGLGLGAEQMLVTVTASLTILGVMALLKRFRGEDRTRNLFLALDWEPGARSTRLELDQVSDLITSHTAASDLRRFDARDNSLEALYFVDVTDPQALTRLTGELKQTFPGIGVTFIDQNRLPSV